MKYFKLFLMWLGFITIASMFGEYIISREVNGFFQLLCLVGVVGIFMYVADETFDLITNKKNKEEND
jgi:TRAP-type C4-dicarboxylate transport system permease small subunit